MNELSREDIQHLSRLSRLELSEEEYGRYAVQLSSVVGYIGELQKVDTSLADGRLGVTGTTNVLAADEVREAGSAADIDPMKVVEAAPRHHGRFFEVRAVLGGETGAA